MNPEPTKPQNKRPVRPCGLCRTVRELCDSHLIPRAIYKILRDPIEPNPNPHHVGDGKDLQTSRQITDYLLCFECEQRLREVGEDWMTANCYRNEQTFRLRETLQEANPRSDNDKIQVYETASIPGLDTDALIYFAMSVIWRSAAHRWRLFGHTHKIYLGPYEERVRQFLLDPAVFPDKVALMVRVSSNPDTMKIAYVPHEANSHGFHFLKFAIPGVTFLAFIGGKIPSNIVQTNTAPSPNDLS